MAHTKNILVTHADEYIKSHFAFDLVRSMLQKKFSLRLLKMF